jgi:hypothetical protein
MSNEENSLSEEQKVALKAYAKMSGWTDACKYLNLDRAVVSSWYHTSSAWRIAASKIKKGFERPEKIRGERVPVTPREIRILSKHYSY